MSHHNSRQNDPERQGPLGQPGSGTPSRASARVALAKRAGLSGDLAGWVVRIVAITALAWAALAPAYRAPSSVSAAAQPADASLRQATGTYTVAGGAIGNYYTARGGARTFGPAASNAFTLLGAQVQIFRNHVLKVHLDGSVSTMPLLDLGAVPGTRVGGRTLPDADPTVLGASPDPGARDYATQVQAFLRATAPDEWEGLSVGFHRAFLGTVTFQDAYPSGSGERGLLPGMAREVWGLPVSRPMRDPATPDVVYLRWERGVMAFDARTGQVETLPLGETFRAVLTGEDIPQDLLAAAQGSQFHAQFQPNAADGVARPDALPDSSLASAFQVSTSSGFSSAAAAGQQFSGTATPTQQLGGSYNFGAATPTPFGNTGGFQNQNQGGGFGMVTPTPFGYTGGFQNQGGGFGTATPTPFGYTGGFQNQNQGGFQNQGGSNFPNSGSGSSGGIGGSAISGGTSSQNGPLPVASPGVDQCFGDEQITFAPDPPRVGNEFLIAVSSSRPHPFGRLAGTEQTQFQRERPGQVGLVWEWLVRPNYPGKHEYTFYVDSTIPCKKIEFTVEPQLATATVRPTRTPRPPGFNNNNNNSNSNGNSNSNSNDNGSFSSTSGADVQLQVNNAPSQLAVNEEREYTVTVSNGSGSSADGVTFSANISSSSFSSFSGSGGATFTGASTDRGSCSTSSGTSISCNLNRLDRNQGAIVTLRVRATNGGGSSFTTNYNAYSSTSDSNTSNNASSSSTTVTGQSGSFDNGQTSGSVADVQVQVNNAPAQLMVNDEREYTVGVSNGSGAAADSVTFTASISSTSSNGSFGNTGATFTTASTNRGSCSTSGGTSIQCSLNRLDRNEGATISIRIRATSPGASITTNYSANTTSSESNYANNQNSSFLTVSGQGSGTFATPTSTVASGSNDANRAGLNCFNYVSQFAAQARLRANPSDPDLLDYSYNGIACEPADAPNISGFSMPSPYDTTPVSRSGGGTFGTPTPTPFGTPTTNPVRTNIPVPTTNPVPTTVPIPTVIPTPRPFNPADYIGQGNRYNCVDFASQSQAQEVLRLDPSDPNKLDTASKQQGDGITDGIACTTRFEAPEWSDSLYFPEPLDLTPVARPPQAGAPSPTPITAPPPGGSLPTG